MRKYLVLFVSIFIIAGCNSNSSIQEADNFEIFGEEKDEIIGEYSDSFLKPVDRDREPSYGNMIQDHLQNIPTSRYKLESHGYESGLIIVFDEEGNEIFKEVMDYGINSSTLDIRDDYIVEVSGFEWMFIEEVETEMSHTLSSGVWQVGADIESGDYTVSGIGYGHLQIFDRNEEPRVFEIIGNEYSSSSSEVKLRDGQKLRINGLAEVNFEAN